jgi:Kef-type K+ transport system membrane component KefB
MLFIPFFFIMTGALVEVETLFGTGRIWAIAGALAGFVLVGKLGAAWFTGRRYGYPRIERLLMAGLTLPQAAATLAVAITAREAGLFTEELTDAIVVLIFITCLVGPVTTSVIGRRLVAADETLSGSAIHHPLDTPPSQNPEAGEQPAELQSPRG